MTRDGVTRLNRKGVIQQNGRARGKFDLVQAVSAYATDLRENKDTAEGNLFQERERKIRLANDKAEGKLLSVADAAQVFAPYTSFFRGFVLKQLPGMATKIANCNNPSTVSLMPQESLQAISKKLTDDVHEAIGHECKN